MDALAGAADRTGEAVKGEGVNRGIKMDINNWVRQVDDVLSNSRSKIVRENRYGISIGMDLLLAYLKEIAGRAIELEDEKLIDILLDLHVLKKEEDWHGLQGTG